MKKPQPKKTTKPMKTTPETPQPTTPETPQPTTPETPQPDNLEKVLADSKAELENPEIKRGRGRPPKDGSIPAGSPKPRTMKVSPDFYKGMLKGLILLSGEFMATGSKFDGFKISDGEADALATSASECAVEFMPTIESKWVKLGMFVVATGVIYVPRYMAYDKWDKQRRLAYAESLKNGGTNQTEMPLNGDENPLHAN